MTTSIRIVGNGTKKSAKIFSGEHGSGLLVYNEPVFKSLIAGQYLVNPTFGIAMNQAVTFTGTPELIHDGGDATGWTGTGVSGTWDFAASGLGVGGGDAVTITNANDLDTASFADATETVMSGFTAITGQVNLITYSAANNEIVMQFHNNGLPVGNSINLNEYISTGVIGSYQGFVIPKADFGLNGTTVDEFTIVMEKSAGPKPTVYFDNIQIEESGEPAVFTLSPRKGTRLHVNSLIFSWVDVGTGGTAYAYDKIGALATLANGINVNLTNSDVSGIVKSLGDFLCQSGQVTNLVDDGTNTFVTMKFDFKDDETPIMLDPKENRTITVTINDDLSGLDLFTCFAGAHEEDLT